ncbi:MAG: hypothetical protein H6708_14345 [Kofleriaceae bacterium]|nr:hypothetical protein [Kofleriaceae bacterium]
MKAAGTAAALVAAALLGAGVVPAAAQPAEAPAAEATERATPPPPRWGAALALPSLTYGGLAVDVERDLPARGFSLVGGAVIRAAATGDYGSTTLGASAEIRRWFKRRAIWTHQPRGAMIGWYLGGRLDVATMRLTDDAGARVGGQVTIAASVLGGYRLAPWRGLTVTPTLGLSHRVELDPDGRLPAWHRGAITFGVDLGWLF